MRGQNIQPFTYGRFRNAQSLFYTNEKQKKSICRMSLI